MMKEKKIYIQRTKNGIGLDDENGVELIKNMINEDGINVKRCGHQNVLTVTDKDFNPLKINGIFDFSYVENEQTYEKKIIHAGNKLFKSDSDFKNLAEIPLPDGISLKNERTQAYSVGNLFWILHSSGILIYDGKTVRNVCENENVYIPNTTIINDEGERNESPNLYSTKRINTFLGTTNFRDSGSGNVFYLDEAIDPSKEFVLEVKIRTRTSEEKESDDTSMYIGVDSLGSEVNRIVTVRFARSKISENSHYFLAEPIKDEGGNIINLKIDNEVLTFEKIPFGMRVINGREVRLSFDLPAPLKGEDNIVIKYETRTQNEDLIKNAKIMAISSGEKGKDIMLLNFGDNKIYFTDEKRGFFYLPEGNQISFGTEGEKITSIVKLSDNLVGIFKEKSFYRVRFSSSSIDGYEIISSIDTVGAYSPFSTTLVDYDCLAFNSEGIYGVSELKSTSNVFNCLRLRSSKINRWLSKYSESERKNAVSISFKSRYYLFIGGEVYIADTRKKYRDKGKESDAYEYEWWIWDNCHSSALYSDGKELYFGRENGQICKFTKDFADITKHVFSNEALSLLLNNNGLYTEFIIPKAEEIDFDIARASLGKHQRLLSVGAIYENGVFYLSSNEIVFPNGCARLYENDALSIYDKEGNLVLKTEASEVDLIFKSVLPKSRDNLVDGEIYDIYLRFENGCDYDILAGENGVNLLLNGEKIKIIDEMLTLTVYEIFPIECIYKTTPISFDSLELKTLYNLFLKLTDNTRGEVEISLETEKSKLKKRIFIGEPFDFDGLDFGSASFSAPFKSTQLVKSFLRNFGSLLVEIKSKSKENFGLEEISLLYLKTKKIQ